MVSLICAPENQKKIKIKIVVAVVLLKLLSMICTLSERRQKINTELAYIDLSSSTTNANKTPYSGLCLIKVPCLETFAFFENSFPKITIK